MEWMSGWASQQARELGDHWFGGEHLLLALSQEPSIAREVLGELGVTHARLLEALQPMMGSEDPATGEQPAPSDQASRAAVRGFKSACLDEGSFIAPDSACGAFQQPPASQPGRGMMIGDRPEIVTTRVTLRTPKFCNKLLQVSKTPQRRTTSKNDPLSRVANDPSRHAHGGTGIEDPEERQNASETDH